MIIYLLGIPGSGKSYYAVHQIYYNFSKDLKIKKNTLKKDYQNCYTNVAALDYKLLNDCTSLIWEELEQHFVKLHAMYKDRDKILKNDEYDSIDDCLIAYAKEYDIYKTLFVIDECHNYFDVQKPHLVWWLTYHRHLHHDLILITQNLSLVNSKYKGLAEKFYRAKPISLSLFTNYFYYNYFTDSRMSQASKVEVIKVKKDKKVFELYQSGDSVKTKNVLLRFLLISFFLFFVLVIGFSFFYQSKFKEDTQPPQVKTKTQPPQVKTKTQPPHNKQIETKVIKSLEDIQDPKLFSIVCDSGGYCSSKFFDFQMKRKFIFSLLEFYPYKLVSTERIYTGMYRYIVVIDSRTYSLLASYSQPSGNKEGENMQDNKSDSLFKSFASK